MGYASNYLCEAATVVLGRKGSINNPIFVEERFWNVDTAFGLSASRDKLEPKFLYYFCTQFDFERLNTTVTIPSLTKARLLNVKIPLPPLEEQRRIVEILDAAQGLIDQRKEQIALMDQLAQSLFCTMFGDPVTNPMGWDKINFDVLFDVTTGKLDSNAMVEEGKYPFFTCAKEVFAIDDYAFDQEALLLAGNNAAGVYDVKHYKGKFNAYQRTYVLSVSEDNNYVFARILLQKQLLLLQHMSKGTNTKYITLKILDRLPLVQPPLALQTEFSSRVSTIEAQKAAMAASLLELEDTFAALMQRAFKGELGNVE